MEFSALQFSFGGLVNRAVTEELLETNRTTEPFGLSLTLQDARALAETRATALKANGRIEIGSGILRQIVLSFCSSNYINQHNYVSAISTLVEAFYYLKNETLELIPDDELVRVMSDCFEHRCGGSMDLLIGRDLDSLARFLRGGGKYEEWNGNEDSPVNEEDDDE